MAGRISTAHPGFPAQQGKKRVVYPLITRTHSTNTTSTSHLERSPCCAPGTFLGHVHSSDRLTFTTPYAEQLSLSPLNREDLRLSEHLSQGPGVSALSQEVNPDHLAPKPTVLTSVLRVGGGRGSKNKQKPKNHKRKESPDL